MLDFGHLKLVADVIAGPDEVLARLARHEHNLHAFSELLVAPATASSGLCESWPADGGSSL